MSRPVVKVVVFGGRDFCRNDDGSYNEEWILNAFKAITKITKQILSPDVKLIMVDGVAEGADTVGYRWGVSMGGEPERYPAQWRDEHGTYNPRAGFLRNEDMAVEGTHFIGFWDGLSKGTNDMRKRVLKKGKPLRMIHYTAGDHTVLTRKKEWETL